MTYVLVSPETVGPVAADIESIGAALAGSNAAAAGLTTRVATAAADEVSTAIAALLSQYALDYQELAARAAAFHDRRPGRHRDRRHPKCRGRRRRKRGHRGHRRGRGGRRHGLDAGRGRQRR